MEAISQVVQEDQTLLHIDQVVPDLPAAHSDHLVALQDHPVAQLDHLVVLQDPQDLHHPVAQEEAAGEEDKIIQKGNQSSSPF